MSYRKSRGFISLGLIVILTSMHFSSAVSANPSAPEIYEFSVSPSVLDLTNGDGVVRIRLGARDSNGINDLFGWCHGEPHSDSVRLQIEPRWYDDFGTISMMNTVVSWSYDDTDLFVDLESETIYAALVTMSAVHNCQVTATDNLGNQTTAYTQFNIVKSSPINTPTADASASNATTAAPGTKTPLPINTPTADASASNSTTAAPGTKTPSPS